MGETHESFARTHEVFTGEGENAFWTKIGGVWPHDDGKGFNVELIALPVSGRLVIARRLPAERRTKHSLWPTPRRARHMTRPIQ